MQNIKEFFERLKTTWGNMSKGKKLGFIMVFGAILVSLTMYYLVFGKTTYVPIFSNLNIKDSGNIVSKLDEIGMTDYKISNGGSTILVPEDEVDRLRLNLAMDDALPASGTGFEIFDDTGFAITDEDRKIMYQRAIQGELKHSIMSLEEVEYANVILDMPKDTVFSREMQPGSASIVLQLKPFEELEPAQVKGIISLVSCAVKGIPQENISIVDTNANLLSEGVLEDNSFVGIGAAENRITMRQQFEDKVASNLQTMLEQALGRGKVLVKVSASMNFDSEEKTTIAYDDQSPIIRSQHERILIDEENNKGAGLSPIDNNTQYFAQNPDEIANTEGMNTYETIRNYEIGQTTVNTLKAPGEVTRLTTSVLYDGSLSDVKKDAINNIVVAAVGYDEARGDLISIEGISFDRTHEQEIAQEMERQAQIEAKDKKMEKYIQYASIGGAAFIFLLLLIISSVKRKRRKAEELASEELKPETVGGPQLMPVEEVIQDISRKLSPDHEDSTEKEIKEYAENSPDKVAEIVKTWILKDEG